MSTSTGCPEVLWSLHPQKHAKAQKPSGQGPKQLALGGPALAGRLDTVASRGPFQPQPYCKFVTYIYTLYTHKHACVDCIYMYTKIRTHTLHHSSRTPKQIPCSLALILLQPEQLHYNFMPQRCLDVQFSTLIIHLLLL